MVFKRTYQLQSPKRSSRRRRGWASKRNNGSGSSFFRFSKGNAARGSQYASAREVQTSTLVSRAELIEHLSSTDVDEPTLHCAPWCPSRVHTCAKRNLPLFRPTRVTSLFWFEKVLLLVDTMQIYGLVWATALSWPWPQAWQSWASWTLFLNIDTIALEEYQFLRFHTTGSVYVPRSVWGETEGDFVWYWIAWAIAALVLPLGFLLARLGLRAMAADWAQFRAHVRNVSVATFMLLYLPLQLALSRCFHCASLPDEPESRLDVDPDIPCWGAAHVVMMIISSIVMVVMLWFARYLAVHIRSHVLYQTPALHDQYVRWKEAEYLHGLGTEWFDSGAWLWSSFRRHHAYYVPLRMVMKTTLVLMYALLRAWSDVQADMMFVVLLAWAIWETFWPSYRCGSTWFLSMLIHWTLAVNLVFGSMRAHDMRTPISVDTNFTLTMAIINGTCTLTVAVVMGLSAFSKRIHWPYPTLATSTARSMTSKQRETQRLRQRRGSKVAPQALPADGPAPINHHQAAVEEEMVWVSTLMRSKAEIAQSQLSLPELVNVHQLDSTIVQLREFWRQARDAKCVLAWSIMEAMDDVSALVEVCRPVSYLPNPALASMMPAMVARLRRRADRLALVSPQKRRIFLKLLAFRSWIGDRVFERIEMGMKRTVSVRYYFNPFSVELAPPSASAVSVMSAQDLLRQMPAILRARPTGHPKVTSVAASKHEMAVELMRATQRRWAELLLEYERSYTVEDPAMRTRLREPTEVAAWFAAARQIDAIVQSVDRIDHGNLRPIARSPAEFTGSPTR